MSENKTVVDIIREFDTVIDDAVGVYLDAKVAMMRYANFLAQAQTQSAAKLGIPLDQFDCRRVTYGSSDPNDPLSLALHSTTQGELKRRNGKGGRNHVLLGQHFIVELYARWESNYRGQMADVLKREPDSIRSDVFGDLMHMRNSIVHHGGRAIPRITSCRVLTWFGPDDIIDISDDERFHSIVTEIRKWLEAFGLEVGGSSPGLLARYGPTGHQKI